MSVQEHGVDNSVTGDEENTINDLPRLKTEIQRLKVALESSYARLIIEKHKNRSRGDINLEFGVGSTPKKMPGLIEDPELEKDIVPIRAFREMRSRTEIDLCNTAALKGAQHATELLAHEAKQPLAAACNYLNLLKIKLKKSDIEFQFNEVLDYIETEMRRANSVLEKSRNIWNCPDERISFSIREIINQIHSNIDREVRTADGKLDLDLDSRTDDVLVDPIQIKHVVQNLIRNSIEAFDKENSAIQISTQVTGNNVTVTITDNGMGIDHIIKDTIQPYTSTKRNGSGLGLFLCSSIIKSHAGSMILEPGKPTGTVARVCLPLHNKDNPTKRGADDLAKH